MSKAKILNEVIETSAAMNSMCSEVAKCISPKQRKHIVNHSPSCKNSSANEKRN